MAVDLTLFTSVPEVRLIPWLRAIPRLFILAKNIRKRQTLFMKQYSFGGQIEGSIPSTEEEQKNSDTLIDASHLDLSVMGSMSMGDRIQNWNENEKTEDSPFNGNESPENIASAQFEIED